MFCSDISKIAKDLNEIEINIFILITRSSGIMKVNVAISAKLKFTVRFVLFSYFLFKLTYIFAQNTSSIFVLMMIHSSVLRVGFWIVKSLSMHTGSMKALSLHSTISASFSRSLLSVILKVKNVFSRSLLKTLLLGIIVYRESLPLCYHKKLGK